MICVGCFREEVEKPFHFCSYCQLLQTKNLRLYIMTPRDQKNIDPTLFVQRLKAQGFRFDSEACPVQITKPWDKIDQADGSVLWRQWDGDPEE